MTIPELNIKKIAIAGQGGIGSFLSHFLYDFGVNREQFEFSNYEWDIYDNDTVDSSNLLHQNFTEEDLGRLKVDCIAERYAYQPMPRFMEASDFENYDLIFSCVDSMTFRKELYEWSFDNPDKAFWIDGRCTSKQGVVFNKLNNEKLLRSRLSDSKERTGCLLPEEKETKTAHTLPILVSTTMVQLFLNLLRRNGTMQEKVYML